MIETQSKIYEWEYKKIFDDWRLCLFSEKEDSRGFFRKKAVFLPFIERVKKQDIAPHLLEIKIFPEKILESFPEKMNQVYNGKVNSNFILTHLGGMDASIIGVAYFLNGDFKTGFTTRIGEYTQDIGAFKGSLTSYFKSSEQNFGARPLKFPFGDYIGNFIKNSNLPEDYKESFRDLTKQA